MKTYEEIARGALARANEIKKKNKKRNRIVLSSFAVLAAATAAVFLLRQPEIISNPGANETASTVPMYSAVETAPESTEPAVAADEPSPGEILVDGQEEPVSPSSEAQTVIEATSTAAQSATEAATITSRAVTEVTSTTTRAVTETTSTAAQAGTEATSTTAAAVEPEISTGHGPDDTFGGPEAVDPKDVTGFIVTGEPIGDDEAKAYFAEHMDSILSSLIASGVNAWGAQVKYPGYSHMTLDTTGDVRRNFRDYQLWVDDGLIAIVTLSKQDGEIYATPAFGAPWFSSFASFLLQHRGEKLLCFYNGFMELFLTPDNELYAPLDVTMENPGLDYDTLYCDEIVLIP